MADQVRPGSPCLLDTLRGSHGLLHLGVDEIRTEKAIKEK